jgi:hypothetical protein
MPPVGKHRVVVHDNNVVQVHVSPDVLFNLDKLAGVQRAVLGRLGHQGCCSGFVINYTLDEQEFAVN